MKISVIMATYNGESYLPQQLNSIVGQSRTPDEIVICDDCSTDKSMDILREYSRSYNYIPWMLLQNKQNRGYISSFFRAIENATGDLIILSDQDDIWENNKIEVLEQLFSEHEDMLSIHTNYSIINAQGQVIAGRQIGYRSRLTRWTVKQFCKRLNYCGMSSAFRSTLKDKILMFDPEDVPTHDWLIHALSIVRDGMYVSKEVYSYRRYTGSNVALHIEKRTPRNGIEQRKSIISEYLDYYILLRDIAEQNNRIEIRDYLDELIKQQRIRLDYIEKSHWGIWLRHIINVRNYPSIKAYLCDGLYIIGLF